MDTVTHGIAGALIGKAFFAEPGRTGRAARVATLDLAESFLCADNVSGVVYP